MSQLGWEELRIRRACIKTILLFKIVNNLVDHIPPSGTVPHSNWCKRKGLKEKQGSG
jgi:hypothetical protein